jgi:hypothetical protein
MVTGKGENTLLTDPPSLSPETWNLTPENLPLPFLFHFPIMFLCSHATIFV